MKNKVHVFIIHLLAENKVELGIRTFIGLDKLGPTKVMTRFCKKLLTYNGLEESSCPSRSDAR
jgi:hypothetical protein